MSRVKKIVKTVQRVEATAVNKPFVDFNIEGTKRWDVGSHLHKLKPLPDPNGNRAERRAAKKRKKC